MTAYRYPRPLAQIYADELLKLPPDDLAQLKYEWDLWALPHQNPPAWDWDTWLCIGGRGGGKNVGVTQQIRKDVNAGVRRFNFVGRTAASCRDDMVRGEAGIIAAFPAHERPEYISSQSEVRFHTGATAILLTAEEPEAIQGKNAERTWCDEFSTFGARAEEVWTQVTLATRVGDPRKYITTNSMPTNPFLETLLAEAEERRIAVTRSDSRDNFANLPRAFQLQVEEMLRTAWGRAWITGETYAPEGALWKREWFRYQPNVPPGGRVVIGVDPSGTEDGDETGIVVVKRVGDLGYVLEDLSGPADDRWGEVVVSACRRHRASAVVIEVNRGLSFLRQVIMPIAQRERVQVHLKEVYSRGSKADRALPIANLYELRKFFHLEVFHRLEGQLTTWNPKVAARDGRRRKTSPDRLDALVIGASDLGFHLGLAKLGDRPDARLPLESDDVFD